MDNIQQILSTFINICILEIDEDGNILNVVLNTKENFKPAKTKTLYDLFSKEDKIRAQKLLNQGLSKKKTFMTLKPKYAVEEYVDVEILTIEEKTFVGLKFLESRRKREIEYEKKVENLAQKAEIDELTGLLNRHGYWKRVKGILSGNDPERKLGILMIDIDNLKGINDELGHEGGDKAITQISKLIRDSIRTRDIAVRYGGDEFVIVVEEFTGKYSTAYGLAKRLHKQLSTSKKYLTTISIGVHIVKVGDFTKFVENEKKLEEQWKEAVKIADNMAYTAKEGGKNKIECSESVNK
ncbi:GGDEF domain-containing protein [bacterium]|nr:GGDEF domain-containing protein [bacterium]